jgi:hypothetical protein
MRFHFLNHVSVLERFQLLRSAGFPACGFRRLSSRLFRADQSRDKNVPQTRRQECLRYIKVVTALGTRLNFAHQLFGKPVLLRKGKKNYVVVTAK